MGFFHEYYRVHPCLLADIISHINSGQHIRNHINYKEVEIMDNYKTNPVPVMWTGKSLVKYYAESRTKEQDIIDFLKEEMEILYYYRKQKKDLTGIRNSRFIKSNEYLDALR